MRSTDFISKTTRKSYFEIARKMAMQLDAGRYKRAMSNGSLIGRNPYSAMVNQQGQRFVIGDSMEDIPYPTSLINGKPALKITSYTTPLKLN